MKKNVLFAGMLLVTGISQITAQEKEEKLIPEVTIASKSPQQLYETGKPVKLISAKDLEKFRGQNLTEVLNQVAGIQISGNFTNNSEPKSPKIRGGKSANLLILVDGIPLKDVTGNDYNASDLRLLSLENVESIEILNGASSVLYGSNATVSVIDIKTKKSTLKPINSSLGARGGSFGTFAQNALFNGKIGVFNYQVSGFNEKSDGISAALGENFEKDGFEKQNINTRLGLDFGHFDMNFTTGFTHHLFSFDSNAFQDGNMRNNDTQNFFGGNINLKYNKGKLTINSRYSTSKRLTQDLVSNEYKNQYSYEGFNLFYEIFNQYQFSENINLVSGIQAESQKMNYQSLPWNGTSMEDILKKNDTKISTYDAFANLNLKVEGGFHLDLGARITNHTKFGNNLVYSINPYYLRDFGAVYYKIGFSHATAFIAPTLYQNYGSLPYIVPNFDLKPETNSSQEIDLEFGKKDRTLIVNASVFQRKEKNGFAYKSLPDFTGQFQNVDENKVKGFELGFNYKLNEIINFGGNFSFVEKDKQVTMLRTPKQRVNSFVEILPFKQTRVNLSHQFVSKRDDVYYDASFNKKEVVVDAFHLFNLNVNQKINTKLELYLNIGNLFNKNYVDIIGYNTKPRNYTFGVEYKF